MGSVGPSIFGGSAFVSNKEPEHLGPCSFTFDNSFSNLCPNFIKMQF